MSSLSTTASCPSLLGHLIMLDVGTALGQGRVLNYTLENKDMEVLVSGIYTWPDGVQVDTRPGKGQIYWTCMGFLPSANTGLLMRAEADGSGQQVIVKEGETFTPKQLAIDLQFERLYWSDREGMRVMRCSLDGSNIETLVRTGITDEDRLDSTRYCVGVAIDLDRGLIYWTQKGPSNGGQGRIRRANIDLPAGETVDTRTDIQTLFSNLPEPIDLALDLEKQILYWTDRGDPPFGNTLNHADVSTDLNPTAAPQNISEKTALAWEFKEAIGLSLDTLAGCAFVSDLSGSVYSVDLSGDLGGVHEKKVLIEGTGALTGLAYYV